MIRPATGQPRNAAAPDARGFVLAGGRSSRMAQDKALVRLGGRPLAAYAVRALRAAGLEVSIAGGQLPPGEQAALVEDERPGLGPLSGVVSGLASTGAKWSVFLPVDLPFLPASLVEYLWRHAGVTGRRVTVCSVNGFAETFPAVLERSALAELKHELDAGRGGCFRAFQAAAAGAGQEVSVVAVEALVQCGQVEHAQALPAAWWFLNVNTPDHLRRAEALLPARIA